MLSASQLTALRAAAAMALDLTCSIVRLSDVAGVMTPSTIATDVPVLVTLPTTAHLRLFQSDAFQGREMGVLTFAATQDVVVHDRVSVTGGQTWIVTDLVPPVPNSYQVLRQVLAYYQTLLQVPS